MNIIYTVYFFFYRDYLKTNLKNHIFLKIESFYSETFIKPFYTKRLTYE